MILIAGLGNPDKKYEKTRHNVGFDVLDRIAEKDGIPVTRERFRALTGMGSIENEKVLLVKPLTYMNRSGEAIRAAAEYYDIPEENIIVICDDIYLPVGTLRIRKEGSAGGHNGLKDIILELAGENFRRIRIGVGPERPEMDLVDFVLSRFGAEERKLLEETYEDAYHALHTMLSSGIDRAMNEYNGKKHT